MNALSVLLPGFDGTELPPWLDARLHDGLAGVCLFGDNVASPDQLRRLTDAVHAANPSAVVAIDEEGGEVSRLHGAEGSPFPGNAVLGRLDDLALTERVATLVGHELAAAGVDLALAPVVDVNAEPRNPVIGVRSFGADPERVAAHSAAWVRGVRATGVAPCAKHFPGHGDTVQDSHLARPVVRADAGTVRSRDLAPFVAAIAEGVRTVMSSHILVPALDPDAVATFSRPVLRDLLRVELGFDGVVVSDALDMAGASDDIGVPAAAVRAVRGGCDLLCLGPSTTEQQLDAVVAALDTALVDGTLDAQDLSAATARVAELGTASAATRAARNQPDVARPDVTPIATEEVMAAIDVDPAARDVLADATDVAWVRLETEPNIAVGDSPWGPFAHGVLPVATVTRTSGGPDVHDLPGGATAAVVGRDLHRHAWAADAIADLRTTNPVVAVDMGWPDPASSSADVRTFGASRLMGSALVAVVDACTAGGR